jgi:hypothetical protein
VRYSNTGLKSYHQKTGPPSWRNRGCSSKYCRMQKGSISAICSYFTEAGYLRRNLLQRLITSTFASCHLYTFTWPINHQDFCAYDEHRIPFVQALKLMGKREVYIEAGFAFVPLTSLVSIIITRVRTFGGVSFVVYLVRSN